MTTGIEEIIEGMEARARAAREEYLALNEAIAVLKRRKGRQNGGGASPTGVRPENVEAIERALLDGGERLTLPELMERTGLSEAIVRRGARVSKLVVATRANSSTRALVYEHAEHARRRAALVGGD